MTETLKPLERHKANINVVTGLEPKTMIPTAPPGLATVTCAARASRSPPT